MILKKEFEKHLYLEEQYIGSLLARQQLCLNEELLFPNYSSFPDSDKIWKDISEYCRKYIRSNTPMDYGEYGLWYRIELPHDLIKYSFWKKLECVVKFCIEGSNKRKFNFQNGYRNIENDEDIEYIKENGKIRDLHIVFGTFITSDKELTEEFHLDVLHEFLHAYEDYSRIIKGNKTLFSYRKSTNYNDYFEKLENKEQYDRLVIARLCYLFYFFNKTEIRALLSQFSGEIRELDLLDHFPLDFKQTIENTKTWKEIEKVHECVETIKSCAHKPTIDKLIEIFNSHNRNLKVKNYNGLLNNIENKFSFVKQYIFKKMCRILRKYASEELKRNMK